MHVSLTDTYTFLVLIDVGSVIEYIVQNKKILNPKTKEITEVSYSPLEFDILAMVVFYP